MNTALTRAFDKDVYETDLAKILLETILKKKMVSSTTYKAARSIVTGGENDGNTEAVGGTAAGAA